MRRTALALAFSLLAALAPLTACGASEPAPVVGVSHLAGLPDAAAPQASSAATPPTHPWASYAASRKWAHASGRAFVSQGHLFGRYSAQIVANDAAAAAYATLAPGARLPPGAIVAEVLTGPDGAPGPIFAMERDTAGWTYVEVGEAGAELRRGRLEPCVGCHGEAASQDELFGVPTNGR